jgi:predicted nucleotidyltransferase
MNTSTRNKLTFEEQKLVDGLREYLETDLYFYGSIQRNDYVPGKSDIDVAIFTNNEKSMMFKLQNYLHVDKKQFRKVLWKLKKKNTITYGYKLKYSLYNMHFEFAIYNENSKQDIIQFQDSTILIPFYVTWLLQVLKILYYQLHILPYSWYMDCKRTIFAWGTSDGEKEMFIILNND